MITKLFFQFIFLLIPFFLSAQIIKYSQTFFDDEGIEYLLEYERVNNTSEAVYIEKPGAWRTHVVTGVVGGNHKYDYILFDDQYIYTGHFQNVVCKINKGSGGISTVTLEDPDESYPSSTALYLEWLDDANFIVFSIGTESNQRVKAFIIDKNLNSLQSALVPELSTLPNSLELINCCPIKYIKTNNEIVVLDYNLNTIASGFNTNLSCDELDDIPSTDVIIQRDTVIDLGAIFLGEIILQDTVLVDSTDIDNCIINHYSIYVNTNSWTIHGPIEFCLDSDMNTITIEADSSFAGYIENSRVWKKKIETASNLKDNAQEMKLSDNGFGYYLNGSEEIMTIDFPNGIVEGSGKLIDYGTLENYNGYDFFYDGEQFLAYNSWKETEIVNNLNNHLLWMRVFNESGLIISEEVRNISWQWYEYEGIDFDENGAFVITIDNENLTSLNDSTLTFLTTTEPLAEIYIDKTDEVYYALWGCDLIKYNFNKEMIWWKNEVTPSCIRGLLYFDDMLIVDGSYIYSTDGDYLGVFNLDRIDYIENIKSTNNGHIVISGTQENEKFIIKNTWDPVFAIYDTILFGEEYLGVNILSDTIIYNIEPFDLGELNVAHNITVLIDEDNDGFYSYEDCDDQNVSINPGILEITYNDIDDDCNPLTFDDDLDQDGFPLANDCNDLDSLINPNALEIPDNDVDEDCDGEVLVTSVYNDLLDQIKIYPNPTNNRLFINNTIGEYLTVDFYNTIGEKILEVTIRDGLNSLDLSNIESGIYIIQFSENDVQCYRKVIVD